MNISSKTSQFYAIIFAIFMKNKNTNFYLRVKHYDFLKKCILHKTVLDYTNQSEKRSIGMMRKTLSILEELIFTLTSLALTIITALRTYFSFLLHRNFQHLAFDDHPFHLCPHRFQILIMWVIGWVLSLYFSFI